MQAIRNSRTDRSRALPLRPPRQIRCSEVWGGNQAIDLDLSTGAYACSLWSTASDGDRGGDIYYFSVCDQGIYSRMAIADVAGHGAAVERVSEWLYDALAERVNSIDSAGLLAELNRMTLDTPLGLLTTAAIIGYRRDTHELSYAYAGHHPAILSRRRPRTCIALEQQRRTQLFGVPLGIDGEATFGQESLVIEPGDRLLLHTDGLNEAMDRRGNRLGVGPISSTFHVSDGSLRSAKCAIRSRLRRHLGATQSSDDVTVALFEFR